MSYGLYGNRADFGMSVGARSSAAASRIGTDGLTPGQILRRVWSRRHLLARTTAIVLGAIAILTLSLTPRYTGASRILLEPPPERITNPLDASVPLFADNEKVASEIQVLLSRTLADRVIPDLNLANRPEFNPNLRTSWTAGVGAAVDGVKGTHAAVLQAYYDRLRVYQVGTSRVVAIDFSSQDPQLARDVSNKLVEVYIDEQRRARLDLNTRTKEWLADQISALRLRVAASEARAEEFRAGRGLLEGAGAQLQSQQLTELTSQLTAARAARVEAQVRIASIEQAIGSGDTQSADVDSALEVLQSPLIQQLRASEIQLRREITEMGAQLLPSHPNMVRKEAELADLEHQIRAEVQKIIAALRNQARFSAAREVSLQHDMDQLKNRRAEANRDQIDLRALEREAAADRTLLEAFLARYAEVSARGELSVQDADVRVIARAELPELPSFPQRGPMLMLGFLIACAAGLSSVAVAEFTNRKVRYARDLEIATGVPVIGILPAVPRWPAKAGILPPGEAYADAISTLHASLGIAPARNQRGKVILVTSSSRGEGRTMTTTALARSMAQSGLKVLVVDADFDKPGLSSLLGIPAELAGFSDLLAGRAGFEHVITADPASTAQVIPAGRDYAVSVLTSPRFPAIMDGLARTYDAVLLDCGPANRSADSQLLARSADHCVYLVRWNQTSTDSAVAGLRRLSAAGVRGIIGAVLTRADKSATA